MEIKTIVCNNNDIIKRIKIENSDEFKKEMLELNIKYELIFIKGYLHFKFYAGTVIIVTEEDSYIYYNVSTKNYMIGCDFNFNLISNLFQVSIEKDS